MRKRRAIDWPLVVFFALAYLIAWGLIPLLALIALLPIGWYLLAVAAAGALPSFQWNAGLVWMSLFGAEGFLVILFLRGPMGEELGLRGFALTRLQTYATPFKSSLIIGVLWGAWHLPVLLRRNLVEIVIFMLGVLALTFILTWLFNSAAGSLIPVLLFHAAQNSAGLFESYFPGVAGSAWELVSTLVLVIAGAAVGVSLLRRGRFGRRS